MINIPTFENFLGDQDQEALYEYADYKDQKRISDIVAKAKGSGAKELQLAQTMANAIKDYDKAVGRAEAAVQQDKYEIAQIFAIRAAALPRPSDNNGYSLNSVNYEIGKYMQNKKNRENYEAHLKGLEGSPDLNLDGVFYNVGIPVMHKQMDAEAIKLFRFALIRILQNLAGQQHVWIMPSSYNDEKKVLCVKVSPNFTYPKRQVTAAYKEYPKLLADYLNGAYGEDVIKAGKGEINIYKDLNYKRIVASVILTDLKSGNIKVD